MAVLSTSRGSLLSLLLVLPLASRASATPRASTSNAAAAIAATAEDALQQRDAVKKQTPRRRQGGLDLAAVPLPIPLVANAPSIVASLSGVPQLAAGASAPGSMGGTVGGWFWCAAATAGAALKGANAAQQKQPRRRRGRGGRNGRVGEGSPGAGAEAGAQEVAFGVLSQQLGGLMVASGHFHNHGFLFVPAVNGQQPQVHQPQQYQRSPSVSTSRSLDDLEAPTRPLPEPSLSEDKSMWLWPATPEDTPPQSPRTQRQRQQPPRGMWMPMMWQQPVQHQQEHLENCWSKSLCITAETSIQDADDLEEDNASTLASTAVTPDGAVGSVDFGTKSQPPPWWTAAGADHIISLLGEEDTLERKEIIQWIVSIAWTMSGRRHGCRVVQRAVEVANREEQLAVADQLKTHVVDALKSPHANHVLQRCVVLLPPERLKFVIDELRGRGADMAKHRFGCRVLERLIEHCPAEATAGLVEEIIPGSADLSRHEFGNYVVQHILEHGTSSHQATVVDVLTPQAYRLAKHRVASHVVERALLYCGSKERQKLQTAMKPSGDDKDLASLGRSLYGSFVVRQLARAECM